MKRAVVCIVVFVVVSFFGVSAQSGSVPPAESAGSSDPQFGQHRTVEEPSAANKEQQHELKKEEREKHQKQLKDDTGKLLQLATELKESVDKTNENVLSLDVVKKAEEIEKLAKHIKTNMRDEMR